VPARVGLRKIVENEPDTAVGEAANGAGVVIAAVRLRPDAVVMDTRMPVLDGIEATSRLTRAQPATRVMILTTFGLDSHVYQALRARVPMSAGAAADKRAACAARLSVQETSAPAANLVLFRAARNVDRGVVLWTAGTCHRCR
jgi:DNA-binding NarL/FixJ family response regulator